LHPEPMADGHGASALSASSSFLNECVKPSWQHTRVLHGPMALPFALRRKVNEVGNLLSTEIHVRLCSSIFALSVHTRSPLNSNTDSLVTYLAKERATRAWQRARSCTLSRVETYVRQTCMIATGYLQNLSDFVVGVEILHTSIIHHWLTLEFGFRFSWKFKIQILNVWNKRATCS
jgi:hypothetical protein